MPADLKRGAPELTKGATEAKIGPKNREKEGAAETDLDRVARVEEEKDVRIREEIKVERAGMGAVTGARGRYQPILNAYIAMVTIM